MSTRRPRSGRQADRIGPEAGGPGTRPKRGPRKRNRTPRTHWRHTAGEQTSPAGDKCRDPRRPAATQQEAEYHDRRGGRSGTRRDRRREEDPVSADQKALKPPPATASRRRSRAPPRGKIRIARPRTPPPAAPAASASSGTRGASRRANRVTGRRPTGRHQALRPRGESSEGNGESHGLGYGRWAKNACFGSEWALAEAGEGNGARKAHFAHVHAPADRCDGASAPELEIRGRNQMELRDGHRPGDRGARSRAERERFPVTVRWRGLAFANEAAGERWLSIR